MPELALISVRNRLCIIELTGIQRGQRVVKNQLYAAPLRFKKKIHAARTQLEIGRDILCIRKLTLTGIQCRKIKTLTYSDIFACAAVYSGKITEFYLRVFRSKTCTVADLLSLGALSINRQRRAVAFDLIKNFTELPVGIPGKKRHDCRQTHCKTGYSSPNHCVIFYIIDSYSHFSLFFFPQTIYKQ
ncbi:hypothetical protein IMSAG025_02145 [Muribaculaceae bacterium]|nr:hypothetical protein IMSAG025_02145 [Muribaculaceae bacterium]